jgi:hypothetical protein
MRHGRVGLACAALALLGAGCSGISASTNVYSDAPTFQPTDAKDVEVLQTDPTVPYVALGDVTLVVDGNPSQQALTEALQKYAAPMGATAVVVVFNGSQGMGVTYPGPLWSPSDAGPASDAGALSYQVLIAVALRDT